MPNHRNIAAPINVHGIGRSGTTLLQNILGATGEVQVCNETAGLVFCCYRGAEVSSGSDDRDVSAFSADIRVAAVRAALCAVLPSDKPCWCQKLGGLPNYIRWDMVASDDRAYAAEPYAFPYRWFWDVLRTTFPDSKDVLILRDYRDVIVSRHHYSGWRPEEIAADVAVYLNLMAHDASKIDCVIRYEDLVARPEKVVHRLMSALGLTGGQSAVQALAWHGSPSPEEDLAAARNRGFSWRAEYASVLPDGITRLVTPAVRRLEERFGIELSASWKAVRL